MKKQSIEGVRIAGVPPVELGTVVQSLVDDGCSEIHAWAQDGGTWTVSAAGPE